MNDALETQLREALRARAAEVDPAGVQRVLAVDYAAEIPARRSRLERLLGFTSRDRRRPIAMLAGLGGVLLVAAALAVVLTLGGTPAPALAGWTAQPTRAHAGQTAAALRHCSKGRVLIVDTRGPYTVAIVAARQLQGPRPSSAADRLDFCIYGGGISAGGSEPMPADTPSAGHVGVGSDSVDVSGTRPVTLIYGRAGAGVSAVTIDLNHGPAVTATVSGGWYLAWWPGYARAVTATVTTAAGTRTSALQGVAVSASACPGGARTCSTPAGIAPGKTPPDTSTYRLFRRAAAPAVAGVDRPAVGVAGALRYLDRGQNDGVTAVANIFGTRVGTEVCVLVRVDSVPGSKLTGACNGPSPTSTAVPEFAGPSEPRSSPVLVGLIPDGIDAITFLLAGGRTVTAPVRDNTVVVEIHGTLKGIRWRDRHGELHTERESG